MLRRQLNFGFRKNKAPVRWARRQEKKKLPIYLADKMSSDDYSMVTIPQKTRSKTKSGYMEKALVKRRKFSRDPRPGAAESNLSDNTSYDDDLMVLKPEKTRRKARAPVKRRKINRRDPRLGAAERIRESFREIIAGLEKPWYIGAPAEEIRSDDSDYYNSPANEPGIDLAEEKRLLEAYTKKHFPKSRKDRFKKYDAQLDDLEKNEKEYLAERDLTVALKAVKFYNRKHSTNYVVEETLGSYNAEFDDGLWTHCNFRAQNIAGPPGRRPVSQLFFAELFGDVDKYKVDSCVTLDGPGHCCDFVRGCEMCPKWVCHPVNGFKNGHRDESSYL